MHQAFDGFETHVLLYTIHSTKDFSSPILFLQQLVILTFSITERPIYHRKLLGSQIDREAGAVILCETFILKGGKITW